MPATLCRVFARGDPGVERDHPQRVGLVRVMPYKAHVAMDFATGVAAYAAIREVAALPLKRPDDGFAGADHALRVRRPIPADAAA